MRFGRLGLATHARFARLDGDEAHLLDGPPWMGGQETTEVKRFTPADLRCPVQPSKIVCVGRNYAAHARELSHSVPVEPLLFLKPPSALIGPNDAVVLPPESARVEHEAELAVVMGRRCRRASSSDAVGYVFGYACSCDVTARDLQRKDVQFTRSKGFDTFCPIGPWIETDVVPDRTRIRCLVGGVVRQDASTEDMIFDVSTVVAFISHVMTLEAGDVILTGTPQGVGVLLPGDSLEIQIDGIGILQLSVQA
jgi:2-keto-4-pentenoate hydratase/2-oxohepta-3-ene-1,7-dioic acid hydratase in catechol pathway